MKNRRHEPSELDRAMTKEAKAREMQKAKATGTKIQPRRNR